MIERSEDGKRAEMIISRRDLLKRGAIASGALMIGDHAAPSFASLASNSAAAPKIVTTRCEGLTNPLGLQILNPRLSWCFGRPFTGVDQVAYQIAVSSRPGGAADLWDSGRKECSAVAVEYVGKQLVPHQEAYWKVRTWFSNGEVSETSQTSRWSMGPCCEADWGGSRWIGRDVVLESDRDDVLRGSAFPREPKALPAPYFRKKFTLHGALRSAFLYISALGWGEVHVNGTKLDPLTERNPGFTNYDFRVLYVTYDVTSLLHDGPNVLGIVLGTGWYDVHDFATWHFDKAPWRARPKLRSLLVLQYTDGKTEDVISDSAWSCTTGPILRDGIYTGEIYDARLEMPRWSTPTYDARGWDPVLTVIPPKGALIPLSCEPVRITGTIVPVAISEPRPGIYIVNLGQNFSGHAQLRLKGPRGAAITMRYAESLNPDGTLNAKPIDRFMLPTLPPQPFQQDTYICKGSIREEVWEQRFSYSGFQYVEVTNFPGKPTKANFRGRFAHTDVKSAGEFTCSSEIANRIQHAARWSYLSNAQNYPTDCPQREKNGWMGDAGIAVECGLMNFQSAPFYRKWLLDIRDAQWGTGGLPVIVPDGGWAAARWKICPPWNAAYLLIVWNVYRYTGDPRVLAEHVRSLQRYVEYFLTYRQANGLARGVPLGDWAPWKTVTPLDFITNAYLYLDLVLLANIYQALSDTQSAERWRSISLEVANAMHRTLYHPDTNSYSDGSQTAQSTALYFGLVPPGERRAVLAQLVDQVERLGHIDVGILGAKHLLRALSEGGRTDLAFQVATQTDMPGWGYWVKTGSTTLWEKWKGGTSYNHIMFGDISAWFYAWIAGIQQEEDSVGFEHLVFRPNPVGGLTHARGSYLTPRGPAVSSWTVEGKKMHLTLQVPCSASARLVIPMGSRFEASGGHCENQLPASEQVGCYLSSGLHEVDLLLP